MTAKVLTVQAVEKLKPDPLVRREIPDAGMPSLYLIIHPTGRKAWCVRYRFGGRTRKMMLGPYPALDLPDARDRARDAVKVLSLGRDPGAEKIEAAKATRARPADHDLIVSVVEDFLTRHVRKHNKPTTAATATQILHKDVVPIWGRRKVADITRRDVLDLLDKIVDRGSPVMANRVLATVRKFFNWCVDRSIITASPCAGVKAPSQETTRDRVLSDAELRLIWTAAERVGWPFGPFAKLLVLTAQRRDEVAGIARSELQGQGAEWHLPGARSKNGLANIVPLSDAAQAILSDLPKIKGDYLLTTTGEGPIRGYSRAKRRLDDEIAKLNDGKAIAAWTFHDLRRTAASGMARLGTDPHVVEAVLNHRSGTISGVAAVYNRYQYLSEKRAALKIWANLIEELTR